MRLHVVVVFVINTQLPSVGFEPGISYSAVWHVTTNCDLLHLNVYHENHYNMQPHIITA